MSRLCLESALCLFFRQRSPGITLRACLTVRIPRVPADPGLNSVSDIILSFYERGGLKSPCESEAGPEHGQLPVAYRDRLYEIEIIIAAYIQVQIQSNIRADIDINT